MSDIKNTSACKNKKFDSFSLTDNIGNSYLYVRTGKNWYNITKCEVCTDGHIDDNDGLVTDAIPVHAEVVAYLVAESEARKEQLEKVRSLLEDWISLRRFRSRKARQRPKQMQKKEAAI